MGRKVHWQPYEIANERKLQCELQRLSYLVDENLRTNGAFIRVDIIPNING